MGLKAEALAPTVDPHCPEIQRVKEITHFCASVNLGSALCGPDSAAADHEVTDRNHHRLAVLIQRRGAQLDHPLTGTRARGVHLQHLTLDPEFVARAYRSRPLHLVESSADDAAGGLQFAIDQEPHGGGSS